MNGKSILSSQTEKEYIVLLILQQKRFLVYHKDERISINSEILGWFELFSCDQSMQCVFIQAHKKGCLFQQNLTKKSTSFKFNRSVVNVL